MSRKRKSLGRDPFEKPADKPQSKALRELISGKSASAKTEPKEVKVQVSLTPSNIRQLDDLRKKLSESGKGEFSRNQLIKIAIALLSLEDF